MGGVQERLFCAAGKGARAPLGFWILGFTVQRRLFCAAGKGNHVPYRDSKLTRVLQDALGGSARTALIVCASPCSDNAAETLSSLRFGARARGIVNVAQVNKLGFSSPLSIGYRIFRDLGNEHATRGIGDIAQMTVYATRIRVKGLE